MRRWQRTSVGLRAVTLLLIAPGFALAEEPVAAEPERNIYIVFKAGPYLPTASNAVDALGGSTFNWPVSYTLELGVGAYWGLFGLQFSVGNLLTGTSDVEVHSHPLLLMARLRLPLASSLLTWRAAPGWPSPTRCSRAWPRARTSRTPRPPSWRTAVRAWTSTSGPCCWERRSGTSSWIPPST